MLAIDVFVHVEPVCISYLPELNPVAERNTSLSNVNSARESRFNLKNS